MGKIVFGKIGSGFQEIWRQFQLRQEFDSNRTSKHEYYLGSRPSADGNWITW
jgi:hypothetical protein